MNPPENLNLFRQKRFIFSIYFLSIACGLICWWLSITYQYAIRGGLFSNVLFYILALNISIATVIIIFKSNLSRTIKFALSIPQSLGILPLAWFVIQFLPVVFFFGGGICRVDFTSPSGTKSIAIESSCFMGCTHSVISYHWLLEKEIQQFSMDSPTICKRGKDFQVIWNSDETEITWKGNNQEEGSIAIDRFNH